MTRLPILLWHLGRRGGGPRYTLELARALAARPDVALSLALSRQSELFDRTAALDVPLLAVRTYSGPTGFLAGFARLPAIAQSLRTFVERHRIGVAVCGMAHLWNSWLVPALKKGGAANVLVVHDALPHAGDNHLVRAAMIRRDIRQADLVVALSDSVRQQLIDQHGLTSDRVIASAMGPFRYAGAAPRQASSLGKAPYRLLFFGRLLPYKGLDQLLEAARLLDRQGIEVTLRVVGQGPLALPDPPPNVRIERRWVAEEEIPGLFAETDLVVLPYQEASQSGVLPIAQHLGVPSVVTPVGGLLEQVAFGRTGFVAADTSAAALAATIAAILLNGESYDRMVSTLVAADGDVCWAGIADSFVAALRSRRRPDPA